MCDVGKKMFDRRKELGLTLEEVGKEVGVGKSTVRKWENGMIKNMGRDKIAALSRVLQMNPVDFVPMPDDDRSVSEDDQERLEALHQDPRLCLLFDRSRKMKPEDVETMLAVTASILKERDGE